MDRKTFLRTTVAGAAALVAAASPKEKKQPSVPLRLSFQEGVTPGETLAEKLDFMEKLGIVGFEPGGKGLAGRVPEIREALQGRDIKVSAICAGFDGFILAEDPAVKAQFDTSMREIVRAAGELGSTGVRANSVPPASSWSRCSTGRIPPTPTRWKRATTSASRCTTWANSPSAAARP